MTERTKNGNRKLISAEAVVAGDASGEVLLGTSALSFWGGVDAHSGVVLDRRHNLCGRCLTGRILVLPRAAGSCSTSGILLEMIRLGTMPAAVICLEAEPLLCMGSVLGEALYHRSMPVYTVSPEDYQAIRPGCTARIADGGVEIFSDEGGMA